MKINKIIIAEPSPIISSGLLKYLEDISQLNVVSIVDNIDDLKDKMLIHTPDILIINPLVFSTNGPSTRTSIMDSISSVNEVRQREGASRSFSRTHPV